MDSLKNTKDPSERNKQSHQNKRIILGAKKMTEAEKYFLEQMKNSEFKENFFQEKLKLDIEYQLEELKEKIKTGKSKITLIKDINKG